MIFSNSALNSFKFGHKKENTTIVQYHCYYFCRLFYSITNQRKYIRIYLILSFIIDIQLFKLIFSKSALNSFKFGYKKENTTIVQYHCYYFCRLFYSITNQRKYIRIYLILSFIIDIQLFKPKLTFKKES
ncbi:hypothetical protein BpHYR1_016937 [Brachionus plicatilis]|uniref:Uncharacterized protein n=1 Tax=Brachionus plicatilis TaxID=10195 RepID=A0A3M7SSA5_BRAPC|nr:hypothetical protein BpHYR1_016937 [Brachionus plicatilis]